MGASGAVEIKGQVEDQRHQREAREDGTRDRVRVHVTTAERRSERRERDSRHQHRFSASEPPAPTRAHVRDARVCFVAIDDVTERQAEMVEQSEFEHALLPRRKWRVTPTAIASLRRELRHTMTKVLAP